MHDACFGSRFGQLFQDIMALKAGLKLRKYAPELHLNSIEGLAKCSPWMDWALFSNFHECCSLRQKASGSGRSKEASSYQAWTPKAMLNHRRHEMLHVPG